MDVEILCECSTKHVPKPVNYIQKFGINLCPTSACNLDALLLEWSRCGGEPPGSVTKHYSLFIREIAKKLKGESYG